MIKKILLLFFAFIAHLSADTINDVNDLKRYFSTGYELSVSLTNLKQVHDVLISLYPSRELSPEEFELITDDHINWRYRALDWLMRNSENKVQLVDLFVLVLNRDESEQIKKLAGEFLENPRLSSPKIDSALVEAIFDNTSFVAARKKALSSYIIRAEASRSSDPKIVETLSLAHEKPELAELALRGLQLLSQTGNLGARQILQTSIEIRKKHHNLGSSGCSASFLM